MDANITFLLEDWKDRTEIFEWEQARQENSLIWKNKRQHLTENKENGFGVNYHKEEKQFRRFAKNMIFSQSTISNILWDESFTTLRIGSDKALKYYELLNNPLLISWIELYLEESQRAITASDLSDHIHEELCLSVSLPLIRRLLKSRFKMSHKKASSHPLKLDKEKHTW